MRVKATTPENAIKRANKEWPLIGFTVIRITDVTRFDNSKYHVSAEIEPRQR